jgi:acetyl-CoA synthetase
MSSEKSMTGEVYYPAPEVIAHAHITDYEKVYAEAAADLSAFWGRIAAENFEWYKPWNTVLDDSNAPFYKWFDGARVNIVHNALDRHLRTAARNKAAIIFEG